MHIPTRLLLSLLVLSVAGCAPPKGPLTRYSADPVLSASAFDRFEKLCVANRATPELALAAAEPESAPRKVGNGLHYDRVSLEDGNFSCKVFYTPADLKEEGERAEERSKGWILPTDTGGCGRDGNVWNCKLFSKDNDFVFYAVLYALGARGHVILSLEG